MKDNNKPLNNDIINGNIFFSECSWNSVKHLFLTHHYLKSMPAGILSVYGLFDKNKLDISIGGAVFCNGRIQYDKKYIEFSRMFIINDLGKNTESWFVSRALNMLKEEKPHIQAVVSFADGTQGHVGTIYQALNAIYYGTSGKATFYRDGDGRLRHPRQNGTNITKETAQVLNWIPEKREAKHRYLFLLGTPFQKKKLRKKTLVVAKPYPKKLTV